jgi:hypothetical protein
MDESLCASRLGGSKVLALRHCVFSPKWDPNEIITIGPLKAIKIQELMYIVFVHLMPVESQILEAQLMIGITVENR